MRHLILIVIAAALVFMALYTQLEPLPAVTYMDPNKMIGLWYDYASIPSQNSSSCSWAMTHEMFRDPKNHDLLWRVDCYTIDGKKKTRQGGMRSKNQANYAHFQSSSTKVFGHYVFLGSKRYDVIGADSSNRWLVIGHPSLKAGWVLSRTRDMSKKDLGKIHDVLEKTGYDSCDFFTFPQKSLEVRQPLCQLFGKTRMF